jgi:predicted transcriptional regulator
MKDAEMKSTTQQEFGLDSSQRESIEIFVQLFNEVDQLLTRKADVGMRSRATFAERASQRLAGTVGEEYIKELDILRNLRNVIVHTPKGGIPTVAVPTKHAIRRLEEIKEFLRKRFMALDYSASNVTTCTISCAFEDAIRLMSENDYSQIPVLQDGKLKGLFTSSGVSRYISHALRSDQSVEVIKRTPVSRILPQDEGRRNYAVFDRAVTLDTVLQKFNTNRALAAVIITETGLSDGKIEGIITPWDIGRITESLLVRR